MCEAYPRACGATGQQPAAKRPAYGLPPRVRGNRASALRAEPVVGPTPARAGQPLPSDIASLGVGGLPPRVRGNRSRGAPSRCRAGPTPARAGQPGRTRRSSAPGEAYPRACGATLSEAIPPAYTEGLPPRVRGNPRSARARRACEGPTPARAGQPARPRSRRSPRWAYPRACGATHRELGLGLLDLGLPPRVRGNRREAGDGVADHGPTPARAGQPVGRITAGKRIRAYPRACGATMSANTIEASATGLPPRVRGNQLAAARRNPHLGPTPARAGQPLEAARPGGSAWAYPRACGATFLLGAVVIFSEGLPPRVRGNLAPPLGRDTGLGPTPARAGQPRSGRRP